MSRADEDGAGRQAKPGALIGTLSLVLAAGWMVGALAVVYALLGPAGLQSLTTPQIAAVAAGVFLPALMAYFAGAAAREGAHARAEAQRLADAADRLLNPEQSAEDGARKLALSVRGEITTLDNALEQTIARLREVEGLIGRQAAQVDEMAGVAKENAGRMITGMEREREELLKISRELNTQAQSIGSSISRHTHAISEAARQAEQEVRAADQALDHRLTSFGAAAALITDRTQALSGAAQASADSALRLEGALSNALDVLAKATNLTDAARQSAEAATLAANSTAGAVRDTTARAIEDAKRAADVIRGEAVNVEREAAIALERLRDAADAARAAAIGARHAVEDERPRGRNRQRQIEPPRRTAEPPKQSEVEPYWRDEDELIEPDPLESAPPPRYRAEPEPQAPQQRYRAPAPEPQREEPMFGERARPPEREAMPSEGWTWRQLLSSIDEDAAEQPKRRERSAPREDAVSRLTHQISEPRSLAPNSPAVELISTAGLRLDEVFSASALERIAQRARSGTQARRRAVRDAAEAAVERLSTHLSREPRANQEALQFLRSDGARIAELLARGRAAMGAEATRAFLLIDSAAGQG
ncbi:MAG: hypothetical protein AB7P07_05205 [Hyphomonadaceae bacterium]